MGKFRQIIIWFAAGFFIFLWGCAGQKGSAHLIFAPVEEIEHSVSVDSRSFPDTVALYFCAEDFSPSQAELTEIVAGRVDKIPFVACRPIADSSSAIVFVEDCSGSMLPNIPRADRIIRSTVANLSGARISLIRIGREVVVVVDSMPAEMFRQTDIASLPYPSPKGTALAEGIERALDIIGNTPGVVVVITDGSIGFSPRLDSLGRRCARRDVPLIVFQIDGAENPVLKDLAFAGRGFYTAQRGNLIGVLSAGWKIKYLPAVKDTDGAEHRVVLRWGAQKRVASYFAPGTPPVVEKEETTQTTFQIPAPLVEGIRVPFEKVGNARILPVARPVLDSVIAMISAFPDTVPIKLRIDGYTCDLGGAEFNYNLSRARAMAVVQYIRTHTQKGVEFEIHPHGEDDPLVPNTSEQNRRINRRVEIRLIPPDGESFFTGGGLNRNHN